MERDSGGSQRLGDFEILRELGRGGMGVVYEAWQVSLERRVALKVLAQSLGLNAKAVERFHREARAAAKLHHTHIVPIYATGEVDDTHYYAMEYLPGPSLDVIVQRLRRLPSFELAWKTSSELDRATDDASTPYSDTQAVDQPGSPASQESEREQGATVEPAATPENLPSERNYFNKAAKAIAGVADGLDYAHQQGIIHRDIKPSNLLLASDGHLSINDFGLARVVDEPGVTLSGEILGSPTYMSPEQVAAGRVPLDQRTDIYSLGATLYELLTLQPPFPGRQRDQVLAQIIQKDPAPPHQINRNVPADLETICLKALDRDPDGRYQTSGEMADDLRRFASSFTISARRPGPVSRAIKWVRRRPAIAFLLASLILVLFVTAFLSHRWYRAAEAAKVAQDRVAQFISQLESRGREVFDRRNEIVAACRIQPGMAVADIGAGTGFFTQLFSSLVAADGHVFSVEVSRLLFEYIERTCLEMRLNNVTVVNCRPNSVDLADESIDLAFICDTYRYFQSPRKNIRSVHRALRADGHVVVIDSHRRRTVPSVNDATASVLAGVRASEELIEEIEAAGFKLVEEQTFLKESYFLRFEKKKKKGTRDKG